MRGDWYLTDQGSRFGRRFLTHKLRPEPTANGLVHLKPKAASLNVVNGLDAKFPDMGGQADVTRGFRNTSDHP